MLSTDAWLSVGDTTRHRTICGRPMESRVDQIGHISFDISHLPFALFAWILAARTGLAFQMANDGK